MSATTGWVSIRLVGMGADRAIIACGVGAMDSTLTLHILTGMGILAYQAIGQRQCTAPKNQEYTQHCCSGHRTKPGYQEKAPLFHEV